MRETAIVCNNEHEIQYIYLMLCWEAFPFDLGEDAWYPIYVTQNGKKFKFHWWQKRDHSQWNNKKYRLVQAKNISKKASEDLFN